LGNAKGCQVKKFKLSHLWAMWEAEVEIDEKKAAPAIKEMVEFWTGWEGRLEDNNGNYLETFLIQFAREIFIFQAEHSYNLGGVIEAFASREGWAKMDGSQGIKILSVDSLDFDYSDFSFEER
jgi:hypothetical protein